MKFLLPYDKKQIPVEIDDQNFAGSLVSKVESYQHGLSQQELVEASLDHPIGSPGFEELVKARKILSSSAGPHPVPCLPKSLRLSFCGGFVQGNRMRT